jgi:hypothetical protein
MGCRAPPQNAKCPPSPSPTSAAHASQYHAAPAGSSSAVACRARLQSDNGAFPRPSFRLAAAASEAVAAPPSNNVPNRSDFGLPLLLLLRAAGAAAAC